MNPTVRNQETLLPSFCHMRRPGVLGVAEFFRFIKRTNLFGSYKNPRAVKYILCRYACWCEVRISYPRFCGELAAQPWRRGQLRSNPEIRCRINQLSLYTGTKPCYRDAMSVVCIARSCFRKTSDSPRAAFRMLIPSWLKPSNIVIDKAFLVSGIWYRDRTRHKALKNIGTYQ